MPVAWTISGRLLLLESDEEATFDEWKSALDSALADPALTPNMAIVHDLRRMVRVPSATEASDRAQLVLRRSEAFAICRWAVVVTPGVQFGMGRMAEAFTQDGPVEFRTFTDLTEAKAWASWQA